MQGSLLFDGPVTEGWPEIVVNVDLLTRRNGRPFTATGLDLRHCTYSPVATCCTPTDGWRQRGVRV